MFARLARVLLFALIAAPAEAQSADALLAQPANTLRQLWEKIGACFADTNLSSGSEVTVVFSLKRNGSLNGKPRISYTKLPADEALRNGDTAAIARALDACLPIPITDGLGGAIAGRPIALRIGGKRPTEL
jgi:hypothetical protein